MLQRRFSLDRRYTAPRDLESEFDDFHFSGKQGEGVGGERKVNFEKQLFRFFKDSIFAFLRKKT
jgi:hypothetical protein